VARAVPDRELAEAPALRGDHGETCAPTEDLTVIGRRELPADREAGSWTRAGGIDRGGEHFIEPNYDSPLGDDTGVVSGHDRCRRTPNRL
jgi:hypothetical protein